MLVDEDGKARNRVIQRRATLHWWLTVAKARHRDLIVGPAIVNGAPTEASFSDVPERVTGLMLSSGSFHAEARLDERWSLISEYGDYFEAAKIALVVEEQS